jgi:hypothetical protein
LNQREYNHKGREAPELAVSAIDETENPPLFTEETTGWEKLPRLVSEALTGDDLDFNAHGLLTFLIGAINWKTGIYKGTIRRLAEEVGWEHSDDYLRKVLVRLRMGGWVDYASKPGQRSAYAIRLGGRVKGGQRNPPAYRPTSDSNRPFQSEVTSDATRAWNAGTGDAHSGSCMPGLKTERPVQDRDIDGDEDRDVDGDQPRSNDREELDARDDDGGRDAAEAAWR